MTRFTMCHDCKNARFEQGKLRCRIIARVNPHGLVSCEHYEPANRKLTDFF